LQKVKNQREMDFHFPLIFDILTESVPNAPALGESGNLSVLGELL
jgi:hypothetical protein